MGLRDQFEKLRNYFVEDEDDYDYDDEEAAIDQPVRSEPVPQPVQSRPQPVQRPVPQPVHSQPVQSRPIQSQPQATMAPPAASSVRRSIGGNSGMGTSAYVSTVQSQSSVLSRANTAVANNASRITMTAPHVYADIMEMGNQLKSGVTLIVNFKNMADQQARRSIDFLTGVAYILDGDIQNIGGQSFLVTPTGVSVEGAKESLLASGGQGFESFDLTSN
ncbi:MAG: cell division protein SepF [Streptococcaceae bacterium]|jgi:cell division inhibitor SepF|nr:cell division protein SepF [Streptococcaceae bacterium]